MKNCPNCGSHNVKEVAYRDVSCIVCIKCGYDERNEYELTENQKQSTKAKARYSPYKTGGPKGKR
ncbi:hypothetical protein HYV79_01470 [Candidatus Woesearchaeota archaeon]|nr:hypothetical protein [Candidatus Woesearchaeota archaeon]